LKIKSLKLKNFRNYDYLDIKFNDDVNLFYGDNAQGKTNILEAIYLSGTTKSHRLAKDKDIINFNSNESHIESIISKNNLTYQIDMHLKKNSPKGIAINKVPIKKASELFGIAHMIFFSPEDLNIIKNGPSERRRFLDFELSSLDKIYLNDLSNYNKAIGQRNFLLKNEFDLNKLNEGLDIWDDIIIKYGNKIIDRRNKFISDLNNIIYNIHLNITSDKEKISLSYEKSFKEKTYEEALKLNRSKDIRYKNTSVGPHKDDIEILINNMDVRRYGSQGQQRTVALSLKLSEIEIVKDKINDIPILLLDDVLSELDENRRRDLFKYINGIQTFITCTGIDEYIKNEINIDRSFYVEAGKVYLKNF
jgi:DNA replication and repair protein RecF